jgi:hypothetical protein
MRPSPRNAFIARHFLTDPEAFEHLLCVRPALTVRQIAHALCVSETALAAALVAFPDRLEPSEGRPLGYDVMGPHEIDLSLPYSPAPLVGPIRPSARRALAVAPQWARKAIAWAFTPFRRATLIRQAPRNFLLWLSSKV